MIGQTAAMLIKRKQLLLRPDITFEINMKKNVRFIRK